MNSLALICVFTVLAAVAIAAPGGHATSYANGNLYSGHGGGHGGFVGGHGGGHATSYANGNLFSGHGGHGSHGVQATSYAVSHGGHHGGHGASSYQNNNLISLGGHGYHH